MTLFPFEIKTFVSPVVTTNSFKIIQKEIQEFETIFFEYT